MATALITGVTGQDGSYLAELLISKGYTVVGASRRVASEDQKGRYSRLRDLIGDSNFRLVSCDLAARTGADFLVERALDYCGSSIDEIYHLAAQSQVGYSFRAEAETYGANIDGTMNLLDAIQRRTPKSRVYFAGTSEQLGNQGVSPPWDHRMKFDPVSPYGYSKCAGWHCAGMFRKNHKLYVARGLLFNHESPRRGEEFVTRKITRQLGRIVRGEESVLTLGNLEALRDWGHAADYVEGMWLMLQQENPGDYTIATGESHSVEEFLDLALERSGLTRDCVKQDEEFMRPAEIHVLTGNPETIKEIGWEPKRTFGDLVNDMVDADIGQ